MNALLRWLTSMTDMPLPCQSSSSSRACCRTSRGSVAGPAAKLKTRTTEHPFRVDTSGNAVGPADRCTPQYYLLGVAPVITFGALVLVVLRGLRAILRGSFLDPLDTREAFALGKPDQAHTLCVTTENRNLIDGRAYQRTRRADQHDLLARNHLQRSHRVAIAVGGLQRNH